MHKKSGTGLLFRFFMFQADLSLFSFVENISSLEPLGYCCRIGIKLTVIYDHRRNLSYLIVNLQRLCTEAFLTCNIDSLCYREEMYTVLQEYQVNLIAEFSRRNSSERNFVLIECFCRAGINTHRAAVMHYFSTYGRHCNLACFKSEAETGFGIRVLCPRNKIFGKTVEFSVNRDFSLFVSKVADISERDAEIVACSTDMSAVEVAGIVQFLCTDINKGIIICRINFLFNPVFCKMKRITENTVDLRCAADRIAVLNFYIALFILLTSDRSHFKQQIFIMVNAF